ncbi:MAG: WYL domain-containing protein [Acidimicrobiales bacterium]
MNRLERLHALAELLRRAAPRPVSAASLADRFGVTRRTIERDLAALRRAGVPLYAEHGRTGGQVSLDRSGTTVLMLSSAEVSAIVVALAAAGPHMPFNDAGITAAERLIDSLGPTSQVTVEELRSRIRVRQQGQVPKRARRTVEEALRRSVVVNIDYADADGDETTRSVDPVGFYNGAESWYFIGWCHLRTAGRIFRLDRIKGARLTTRPSRQHDVDETLGWVPEDLTIP